jgi:hypothetical protein
VDTQTTTAIPSDLEPFLDLSAPGIDKLDWKLVSEKLRALREDFQNRNDYIAAAKPWGEKGAPVAPVIPFLDQAPALRLMHREEQPEHLDPESEARQRGRTALLLGHLVGDLARPVYVACKTKNGYSAQGPGRYRVGFYTPDTAGKTKWLCLDFDGAGHAKGHALVDPLDAALRARRRALDLGLTTYLEKSKSGRGYHLWAFFDCRLEADKARKLGLSLAPKDAKLTDGGVAAPKTGTGIEVFPKSKGTEIGSQVWAPWFSGASNGNNSFFNVSASGEVKETDLCS